MSTTLALPGIVEYFVATTGCTADEARNYLAEFSDIIGDSMHKGESVEIAGIGTFKRIGAGEGAEVAFEPSETLTEAVNAPFAMFDPVELDDEVTEEMLDTAIDESDFYTPEEDSAKEESDDEETPSPESEPQEDPEVEPESEEEPQADEPEEEPLVEETVEVAETVVVGAPVAISKEEPEETTEESDEAESEEAPQTSEDVAAGEAPQIRNNDPEGDIEPATPEEEPTEEEAPTIAKDYEPRAVEEERPRGSSDRYDYGDEGSAKVYHKAHRVNVILALLIGLLAGVLIGYIGRGFINLTGVKSVNISADDVQVIHQTLASDNEAAQAPEATAATDSDTTATEAAQDSVACEPQTAAKEAPVVTDTVKAGRYLTSIAQRHYGKKKFWVYIYLENQDRLGNPNEIAPMTVVTVPPLEKYGVNATDKASEEDAERKAAEILRRYPE